MTVSSVSQEATESRRAFFKLAFGRASGYVCIAYLSNDGERRMQEKYFRYPDDMDRMLTSINERIHDSNVYYCPQLLNTSRRSKDTVSTCTTAWADLDTCSPDLMQVPPTLSVESSPGRFQALWVFEEPLEPLDAEDVSRRIAYYHKPQGADTSGWDLTQLLRVPMTPNYKYGTVDAPTVRTISVNRNRYRKDDFACYPEVKYVDDLTIPMPAASELPDEEPLDILQRYRLGMNPIVFQIWDVEPVNDWSKNLWNLEMMLFEAGLTREETFVVLKDAACNKYKRDGRSDEYLWRDLLRAYAKHLENISVVLDVREEQPDIIDADELAQLEGHETFVERYITWASDLGDAATQYHQAGAFTILSALLAGSVRLPTSFGTVTPNLWFMILADTTLTRKSTAMDIAMELLAEVDEDAMMATDGSLEGLMGSLSMRPSRPSVFLRDEFSGLLEMMNKKDYYAGMAEMLTKLYDGKMQRRILRKETIEVRDPVLIILAGGIKNRTQSLLTLEHVSSGFVPRFVFITAESDVKRIQPLGPPTDKDLGNRDELINEMKHMVQWYQQLVEITLPTGMKAPARKRWSASLSPEAWERYNYLEKMMLDAGMASEQPDIVTPTYDRLCKSTLKASVLLAASRQKREHVEVELIDMLHAIKFCQTWREYANEIINGVGRTSSERDLEKVYNNIQKNPGISRAKLMQRYHLKAKQADEIFQTLEQRGMITSNKIGKTSLYSPITIGGML